MLKYIIAGLTIGFLLLAIITRSTLIIQAEQPKPSPTLTLMPKVVTFPPAEPKLLYIPKLNLYVSIENVGVDETGKMETPQDFNNVGWYSLGFKPGEQGSAVMDGHLDTTAGAPAVFYKLAKLEAGDEIVSMDNNGKNFTFVVTKKVSYPYNNAPINDIIYAQDKPRLNIITCDGAWNYRTHNYSDRIVIYTELE